MSAQITNQVRGIAVATQSVAKGDLSKKIEVDARGEIADLANTVNNM
jgi:HAMP domain-containing protein